MAKQADRSPLPPGRVLAVDALRGFAMLWIMGSPEMAKVPGSLGPAVRGVVRQFEHAGWNGFTFYDLILPLFIFVVGVSLSLSLRRRLASGMDRGRILLRVGERTVLLFLLGLFYNGGVSQSPLLAHLRVMGVLQRIALCYFFTALLFVTVKPRAQALIAAGILAGYWLVMRFVPVPGVSAGVWTPAGNLAGFLDRRFLPGRLYYGTWDPEGLLTTVPAIATCLMGALAGEWLLAGGARGSAQSPPAGRLSRLFLAGAIGVMLGLLVSLFFPLNKSLWSSSYSLLTGGLSAILFALFYWLLDVQGYRKWAFPLIVIGMNSIAIYVAARVIPFGAIARRLVGGDVAALFGPGRELFLAAAQLALEWLTLLWLYRRRIFIRL